MQTDALASGAHHANASPAMNWQTDMICMVSAVEVCGVSVRYVLIIRRFTSFLDHHYFLVMSTLRHAIHRMETFSRKCWSVTFR